MRSTVYPTSNLSYSGEPHFLGTEKQLADSASFEELDVIIAEIGYTTFHSKSFGCKMKYCFFNLTAQLKVRKLQTEFRSFN